MYLELYLQRYGLRTDYKQLHEKRGDVRLVSASSLALLVAYWSGEVEFWC
jgi:hypothetical protein